MQPVRRMAMTERVIVIVGTGGHARVVIDLARSSGWPPMGCLRPERSGDQDVTEVDGVPVVGILGDRTNAVDRGTAFTVALGNNDRRRVAFEHGLALGFEPVPLVHPTATLLHDAQVEAGAQVCARAVIGVGARVGRNVIVNTAATVDHDDVIERHAAVAPGAHLAGRVHVEEGAYVGIGAIVREGVRIGAWSFAAAGAVVVSDVAPRTTVAGIPARPLARAHEPAEQVLTS